MNDARDDFNETLYNYSFKFFSEKFEEFDYCCSLYNVTLSNTFIIFVYFYIFNNMLFLC